MLKCEVGFASSTWIRVTCRTGTSRATRASFPVVLLSAEHPSIGRGHSVMPLASLVMLSARL